MWVRLHERALRTGDAKTAGESRAALTKLEGEASQAVLLCDAAAASPAEAASVLARLTAAYGANPTRSDACLALARVHGLAGNEGEAVRITERAFTLEPTRFEAARAWLSTSARPGGGPRPATRHAAGDRPAMPATRSEHLIGAGAEDADAGCV